jgi:putative Mg2+ transporter-C (MgtC) family protein
MELFDIIYVNYVIRIIVAGLCGGLIGYERDAHGSAAGLRTHILVCVGAMLAMATGVFTSLHYGGDASRIGAQVVSGIGFLGAGTIIVHRGHISGLTTAAGLWASACIGLALGTGFYEAAIVGTLAVIFAERGLRDISKNIMKKHGHYDEGPYPNEKNVSER